MSEAGVSGWLGVVDELVEVKLVLRVMDERMPLERSFLDD